MLEYDEMSNACSWHIYSYSHAQILTKCLEWSYISQISIVLACSTYLWLLFVCFSSDEMSDNWFISRFRLVALNEEVCMSFDEMFTIVYMFRSLWSHNISWFLFTCSNFVKMFAMIHILQFAIAICMLNHARCLTDHFAVWLDQSKFWDVSHQSARSEVVLCYTRDVFSSLRLDDT